MKALSRMSPFKHASWDPLSEMESMRSRLDSFFDHPSFLPEAGKEETALANWTPLVDITEDKSEYLIKAELPEVEKKDISVSVHDGTLVITGERKSEEDKKDKKYHRIERSYGKFIRSFSLPPEADASNIRAEFKNGLLTVHLAKVEQPSPERSKIEVS